MPLAGDTPDYAAQNAVTPMADDPENQAAQGN